MSVVACCSLVPRFSPILVHLLPCLQVFYQAEGNMAMSTMEMPDYLLHCEVCLCTCLCVQGQALLHPHGQRSVHVGVQQAPLNNLDCISHLFACLVPLHVLQSMQPYQTAIHGSHSALIFLITGSHNSMFHSAIGLSLPHLWLPITEAATGRV